MALPAKTHQVRIQREAIDELDRIYRYIFNDSPGRARKFIKALKNKILELQRFPQRGSRARILDPEISSFEIRFLEFQGHLIFYTANTKTVYVLHIASPGQDWQSMISLLA
jgi:plasmid stabilization system protein ParE